MEMHQEGHLILTGLLSEYRGIDMSTVNIDLSSDTQLNMILGQQDETEVREVVFDFSGWYTTYGSGTISLSVQRSKDQWPYEVELTVDNTNHTATWTITDTDTGYAGVGMVQITYIVGTAKKKSVVYRFTVYRSLGATGNVITPVQLQTWMDEVDQEITDIKQDLEEIKSGGTGLSDEAKQALLACFQNVAWIDDDGSDYYDALESALYPPSSLQRISCVYTQSVPVFPFTSLDSLKDDLVVTAHYSESRTETVLAYTLSGTLEAGISTVTVRYQGKTATFTVNVTEERYLRSTGTQYINTGVNFAYGQKIEIDGKGYCYDPSKAQWYFGAYNGSSNIIGLYSIDASNLGSGTHLMPRVNPVNQSLVSIYYEPNNTTRYRVAIKNNVFYVDDVQIATTQSTSPYSMGIPMFIFARNNQSTADYITTDFTVYRFKVYDSDDSLLYDFVPMLDEQDVPCMYETVNNQYYYNAGTGTFDCGVLA